MKYVFIVLVVFGFIGLGYMFWPHPDKAEYPEHIYCAGDRLECPDGSTVYRLPPSCDFFACPAP
jgi:hypothetical protein